MKYNEYSHSHGIELLEILNKPLVKEVRSILSELPPYHHGSQRNASAKGPITKAFVQRGWSKECRADFNTDKTDSIDLCKWKVAIEMEFSRFEMFFRDFFRFSLMFEKREIDVGIIITLDKSAFENWEEGVKPYETARGGFPLLVDILKGDYRTAVRVPIWCIGIE